MAFVATITSLLFYASVMVIVVSLLLTALLRYYAKEVMWVEKESEYLEAVSKDFDNLLKEVAEIETQAGNFWNSQVYLSGMHVQLSNDAIEWIESITKVVADANMCGTIFKQLIQEWYLTACFRVVSIIDFVLQIRRIKRAIVSKLNQNSSIMHINESMERSRSKNRSMLHIFHSFEENNNNDDDDNDDDSSIPALEPVFSTSIIDLIRGNNDLVCATEGMIWPIYSMLLLYVFLMDVSQIQLETETQKVWVKQAYELIEEAEENIGTFRNLAMTFGNNLILRNKFTRDMKCISTAVDNLLNKKGAYGFEFVDRGEENSIRFSTSQDIGLIFAMKNTLGELEQKEQIDEINSMFNKLENMCNKIFVREESTFRSVCLEQIKCIAQELNSFLEIYKKEPHLEHFKKLNQIEQATTLLQKIIDVCYIKRRCSSQVVDLGIHIQELVSKLTTDGDDNSVNVISIVGMMGVGKTTLAKEVCNNRTIVNHFSVCAWLTMPFKSDEYSLLDLLKEKHSLVVLDNVSSTEEWDDMKVALSGMENGSSRRIMLTTRFENVASHVGSRSYHLRLRTKQESWKLFQMIFSQPRLDAQVEKLARKVVGTCGGLPLSILSLHCMMSTNDLGCKKMQNALERINQGKRQKPWSDSWSNNYDGLSETLKKCLCNLSLFPQDVKIQARRVLNLWVAEGLVETLDEAEKYLEKLRDLNMIQAVELKSRGKIRTCYLPNELRRLILQNSNQLLQTYLQHHFVYPSEHAENLANPVSYMFFDTLQKNKPGNIIGNIFTEAKTCGQFRKLGVLDLERVYTPQLPRSIRKLTELRYLGLRLTQLETLPSFIGKLSNLETLDIKHTCVYTIPPSIWKLKKLRSLYLSHWTKIEGTQICKFPENLETLCGAFMDGTSPLLSKLQRFKNLKKLKLTFHLTQTEQEALTKLISQQEQLHSLTLRSIDEMGKPQVLSLSDMSNLHKLTSLYLYGNIEGRLREQKLPPNITVLTLSASNLSHDPMPHIQKLPKLRSLCLYSESYTGISMDCNRNSFPQLQVLRFWMLKRLEEWNVEEGAMEKLIELEIRSCSKLRVPSGLKHLRALHKIKLSSMPEKFVAEIQGNQNTFWNNVEIVYD